jgi:membrane protein YdbS with pleckstrin-like domain
MRPEPREQLDPRAKLLWRLNGLIQAAPLVALAGAASWWLDRRGFAIPLAVLPVLLVSLVAIGLALVAPTFLWRRWRYEVGDDEVDLRHGLVTVTRTLVPMARIQHVETRRGPLQRQLGLASVVLYTAAGSSEIPAVADAVADELRDRIAARANATGDEI